MEAAVNNLQTKMIKNDHEMIVTNIVTQKEGKIMFIPFLFVR